MRILQLLSGTGHRGADRVAMALADGLSATGHSVTFGVAPDFLRTWPDLAGRHECRAIHRFHGLPWSALREFKVWAREFDLVLAHDDGGRHFAVTARILGLRSPVWFLRHGFADSSPWFGVPLERLLVAHQVAVSDAVAQDLIGRGHPRTTVTRVYGCVPLGPLARPDPARVEAVRSRWLAGLPAGTQVIGMSARPQRGPGRGWRADRPDAQGHDVLFRALASVRFPWRVLSLGPETRGEQDAVRQIAGHCGADPSRILFPGFVPEPSAHYAAMDLHVLPSRREGLGLAAIEGMAAGVPTVASRSGGLVEVIEDGESGLLIEPGDPAALRACLERLVADRSLRERLGTAGRGRALETFDAPTMVRAFEKLLKRTLPAR